MHALPLVLPLSLTQRPAANHSHFQPVPITTALPVRLLRPQCEATPGRFCLSGKLSDVCRALDFWAAQDALPNSVHA